MNAGGAEGGGGEPESWTDDPCSSGHKLNLNNMTKPIADTALIPEFI